jgi:hypothetical protein
VSAGLVPGGWSDPCGDVTSSCREYLETWISILSSALCPSHFAGGPARTQIDAEFCSRQGAREAAGNDQRPFQFAVSACDLPAATTKRRYAPAAPHPVDRRTPTQDRTLHSSSAGQIRTLPAWPQSGYFRVNRQVARTSHKVASVISRAWAVPA